MPYYFPFGQELHPLVQEDRTPKKVFVLGVYASAVHARWKRDGKIVCQALAVASEPRIFWDGNPTEAKSIINAIAIPKELGTLEPAGKQLNITSDGFIVSRMTQTPQKHYFVTMLYYGTS